MDQPTQCAEWRSRWRSRDLDWTKHSVLGEQIPSRAPWYVLHSLIPGGIFWPAARNAPLVGPDPGSIAASGLLQVRLQRLSDSGQQVVTQLLHGLVAAGDSAPASASQRRRVRQARGRVSLAL